MIPGKIENRADSDHFTLSESRSVTNQDYVKKKEGMEARRKVKKLRSIKLVRLPSVKLTTRQATIRPDHLSILSSDAASSLQLEISEASPNYTKTTTSSNAKKEILQKSARTLTRRSSFKPQKSLTRLSSTKFRSLMRKSSGGSDLKKKVKKSRSIKFGNRCSIVVSKNENTSIDLPSATTSSDVNSAHLQASSHYSESSLISYNRSKRSSSNLKPNLASGNKSMRVMTRTSSLRPLRILTRMGSLRTKTSSMKKPAQMLGSSIHRATCSSALKDSHFPDHLELQAGGRESEGISTMMICPYSYCSLNGHRHAALPPLKRYVSMRRRLLKTQKSIKLESQSFQRAKRFSSTKKGMRTSKMTYYEDAAVLETAHRSRTNSSRREMAGAKADLNGDGVDTSNSVSFAEMGRTRHGKISVGGKVRQKFNEDRIASLNMDVLKGDSELIALEANSSTAVADEPFDKSRCITPNIFVESRVNDNLDASASMSELLEEQTATTEENNKNSMQDCESTIDSEPDCNAVVGNSQMEKQKHMGLWHLVCQHMVTGIAAEDKMQPPLSKMEQEKADNVSGTDNSGSYSDFSGVDQSMSAEDPDKDNHEIQLYQRKAIKLVQEAFDKILSEIQDQSSDDQSVNGNCTLDKELTEKNDGEGGELSISTSSDSGKDSIVRELETMRHKADAINGPEGEKAESNMKRKSNQQTPKSWSNLKKMIILKRFVKALEKVRNINPRKPRYLPAHLGPEAEKIRLCHQTTEERKNSAEWMLDYALQQVISTLAPAQKRKVALLVQAFETVSPVPEIGAGRRSNITASLQVTPAKNCTCSTYQKGSGNRNKTIFGISLRKSPFPEMSSKEEQNQVSDPRTGHSPERRFELKEPSSESDSTHTVLGTLASETNITGLKEKSEDLNPDDGDNNSIVKDDDHDSVNYCSMELGQPSLCDKPSPVSADVASTSHDELPVNGEVIQEVPGEVSLVFGSKGPHNDFRLNNQKLASNCLMNATGEQSDEPETQIPEILEGSNANSNEVSPVSVCELQEESSKATEKEKTLQNKFLQAFARLEESKPSSSDIAHEKQKDMKLWYLIYKHMISGSATLLDERAEKEEQGDDANTSYGMKNTCNHQGFSKINQDINVENHDLHRQKIKLQQTEAIKMVEEAIDEIPLPGGQDDTFDDQWITSDIIPDQEHLEKQPDEFFISTSISHTKKSFGESNGTKMEQSPKPDPKEPCLNSDYSTTAEKEKTVFKERNYPKLPIQNNWSNLKKVILLKRFVKALEKVKEFNPRKPRFLALDPEKVTEKVHLRHQEMEDRKNADEWMLDYALRQVVGKLTPARKRKVQLLVEAFDTVIPTTGS